MSRGSVGLVGTLILITWVDVSLRWFGYARVMRWAVKLVPLKRSNEETSKRSKVPHVVSQTLHTILTATAFYPGRSQCLEQSVAGFMLLRRQGLDVRVRVGVQPYPFKAHAWLEMNGSPLTETPEVVSQFALIPELVS